MVLWREGEGEESECRRRIRRRWRWGVFVEFEFVESGWDVDGVGDYWFVCVDVVE